MSKKKETEEDIDSKITELLMKASEKKIVKRESAIIKRADISTMPDVKKQVEDLTKDGFNTAQIAAALGYDEGQIAFLLEEKQELDSPEDMLKTNLMRLHALVPLADSTYRADPNFRNAIAVTGIIDSVTKTITEIHNLKEKEEVYKVIIQKMTQPIIRSMISDMMTEFRFLAKKMEENPDAYMDHLGETATAIGKKFDENYRRANELLATVIGLNSEAKARALASIALSGD